MKRPYTNDSLVEYSAEHLYYEVRMFFEMVNLLKWRPAVSVPDMRDASAPAPPSNRELHFPTAQRNACVESFMMHLRDLVDFAIDDAHQPTDVIAADFCEAGWEPPVSERLVTARMRVENELAPLSTNRVSGSPSRKPWDFDQLADEMRRLLGDFAAAASPARLSPKVRTLIRQETYSDVLVPVPNDAHPSVDSDLPVQASSRR